MTVFLLLGTASLLKIYMGKIRINNQGLLTTVQDLGRFGYQEFGMPVAGAMDSYSLRLANYLVGNKPDEACLEATFLGSEIEFKSDTVIAVSGGVAPIMLNGKAVEMNVSLKVKAGDVLSFGMMTKGCRIYIAFAGGIDVPVLMDSKSTYLRGKLGGFEGRSLQAEDELKIADFTGEYKNRSLPAEYIKEYKTENLIRFITGTEISRFPFEGMLTFLNSVYTISPKSDRMGYRLSGAKIEHKEGADIISSGISTGAVQVPGHGVPIIMLADHQTVGGYTKIANIISVDIPLLGQMKAGDKIRFTEVRLDKAQELLKEQERKLAELK